MCMKIYHKVRAAMVSAVMLASITGSAQELAVKTNLLSDALTVPSLGAEFTIGHRWTLNADVEWMPAYQSTNHYLRTLKVQPEARFWFRAPFTGPFIGPSAHWRVYNMAGLPVFKLKDERIQGNFYSVGVTAGWHFTLSSRWGLEPSLTLGYAYNDYRRYAEPRTRVVSRRCYMHYLGPTAASLQLVYMLR